MPSITEYLVAVVRFARRQMSNAAAELAILRMRPTRVPQLRQCQTDGFSILVNANETVGRAIYVDGAFEREEVRFLQSNVRPDDICFDVGANIGYFSLLMAKLASRGRVYSIEPVPFNFQLLSTNIQLNRFANVFPQELAVSDAPGKAEFTVSEDGAFSSFIDTKRMAVQSKIVVEVTTLDKFCEDNSIARVDCLKVDVEGAEGKMLAGAGRLLSDPARRPRFIILELYNPMLTQYGSDIQRIVALLSGYGYAAYIEEQGQLRPFTAADYDVHWNVFFLPNAADPGYGDHPGLVNSNKPQP